MIKDLKKALKNKKILVICPKYFGYEEKIVNRLIELGAIVSYIDERPANSTLGKIFIRLFPFSYRIQIDSYYNKKIKEMMLCNIILVINPECLSLNILYRIKEVTKASKYILYMWDSFLNKKHTKKIIPFFDKILTFDPTDADELNIVFRPLFFPSNNGNKNIQPKDIDISFIGTGHSDRPKILNLLKEQYKNHASKKIFFYLYLQTPLIYYFNKLINSNFKKIHKDMFHFLPMPYDEYEQITEASIAVIDIEHPAQKGLTIRTLEMLGKEIKLITTNSNIKRYDFYNESNILIIDRMNPVIDTDFINRNYQPLSADLYYKYSIDGWLEDIVS
ncbi:hypothetical protein AGMMS49546_36980 [Spirochaetia bacterium]|nr:hypothetical protein AGMMS49546_36980 [Spirochaetia bacterium]